jgi:hypothetical protein
MFDRLLMNDNVMNAHNLLNRRDLNRIDDGTLVVNLITVLAIGI